MKTMNGWKVLYDYDDKRESATTCFNKVKYLRNIETFPELPKSKLFFFKNWSDAQKWKDSMVERKEVSSDLYLLIVPCIAKNPRKIKIICNLVKDDNVFWHNYNMKKKISCQTMNAPKGTYVADSIKCLE